MRPPVHKGVLFLGLALIIANGFSTGQFGRIWSVVTGAGAGVALGKPGTVVGNQPQVKNDMFVMMGEVIFLAALSAIANSGDSAGTAIGALIVGLWLIWLTQNGQFAAKFIKAITPQQANVPGSH